MQCDSNSDILERQKSWEKMVAGAVVAGPGREGEQLSTEGQTGHCSGHREAANMSLHINGLSNTK
jgi:hypothetical protein